MPTEKKEKIKVLHIITRLIIGGAQENTLSTVLGLQRKREYDISLLSGPTFGPEGNLVEKATKTTKFFILPQLRRDINLFYDLIALFKLYRFIKVGAFDIVHTHSSKAGILGRVAAHMAKTPIIVHTIHGLPFFKEQSTFLNKLFIRLEKYTSNFTNKIICVSQALINEAVAVGIAPKEKFEKIYSGIELSKFKKDEETEAVFRRKLSIPPNAPVVGKLARLFTFKGHEYLLRAAVKVKIKLANVKFLFIGDGILLPKLRQMTKDLGLEDTVIFAGLVDPESIPYYLQTVDVLAHVSMHEGLPRAVVQGFALGIPTVCFDVDGARDIVVNNVNGFLIEPKDVDKLASSLIRLLIDKEKAENFGRQGKKLVQEAFDVNTMVSSIDFVYKKLQSKCGK